MATRSGAPGAGPDPGAAGATDLNPKRWLILTVIAIAYLMITLDLTVMNLALPSAQHELNFTTADRQWVVTAYALSFGSLLLFCGRLSDLIGRKTTFLAGLVGFAVASAIGGASVNFTMLVTARACQGAFAALLAPSTLALLATTFTDSKERNRAFAVYGAVAAAGSGLGLLIGGALTSYLSWRWCLYVNLVFAVVAFTGGMLLLGRNSKTPGARLDIPGVVLVSGGMFCIVYGFANAGTHDWSAFSTWGFLAIGAVLLVIFAIWQTRATAPLLPPKVVVDRNRGGSYLARLIAGAATFGVFLFLVYYMQETLGYSPIKSGVALLPLVAFIVVTSRVSANVMPRLGPRPLITIGMLVDGAAMVWLTRIGVHSGYASNILGPIILVGMGMGLTYPAATNAGTFGVAPRDVGVASACINTGQQLGGSIGTALLNTIFVSAVASYVTSNSTGRPGAQLTELATVHGYTTVFWWCAGIFAGGAVICGALLRSGPLVRPATAPAPGREPSQSAPAARSLRDSA